MCTYIYMTYMIKFKLSNTYEYVCVCIYSKKKEIVKKWFSTFVLTHLI